jgi:hypothetical protein
VREGVSNAAVQSFAPGQRIMVRMEDQDVRFGVPVRALGDSRSKKRQTEKENAETYRPEKRTAPPARRKYSFTGAPADWGSLRPVVHGALLSTAQYEE